MLYLIGWLVFMSQLTWECLEFASKLLVRADFPLAAALAVSSSWPQIKVEGDFHAFMSHTAIKKPDSPQYQLLHSGQVHVSPEGMMIFRENGKSFVCVALSSRFVDKVGETFNIILENGTVVPGIAADIKANTHTDPTNTFSLHGKEKKCVVEVVADIKQIPPAVAQAGSFHVTGTLASKVVAIQKRGVSTWRKNWDKLH